ncbi:MAG: DUF3494 domain-containing protein [Moraxellaceae bacterium]|nr:DUF3494 domain-containing protein [Moraxellaceae bacterium]
MATQARADATTAFNQLSPAAMPGGTDPGAGQLGGLTLSSGVYQAAGGSFQITGSDLTLDGQGDANAVWVFQSATSLTVGAAGAPRSIILINGAQAKNVFCRVGTAATINAAGVARWSEQLLLLPPLQFLQWVMLILLPLMVVPWDLMPR